MAELQKWKKIGGGSLRWNGQVIKPGQIFEAAEEELPKAFLKQIALVGASQQRYSVIKTRQETARLEGLPASPMVAYIIGGGPSVADVDLSLLKGQFVIAVNRAYEIYPQADILFFADMSFWEEHGEGVNGSPIQTKFTVCSALQEESGIHLLRRTHRSLPKPVYGELSGETSGQMAIELACQLGAKLVVMIGFDMQLKNGQKHYHDGYRHPSVPKTCVQMLDGMKGLRSILQRKYEADIFHATPGSAYTEAEYLPLKTIISATEDKRYFGGWWLPKTERHFVRMLRKGKEAFGRLSYQYYNKQLPVLSVTPGRRVAVDIGANVGFWAYPLAQEFQKVEAFEPVPIHCSCFRANLRKCKNVTLHEVALGEKEGESFLFIPKGDCGDTHIVFEKEKASLKVPMRTLDSYGLEKVDLIKIDCQGYELPILQGGIETIKRCKPSIIVEQHPVGEKYFPDLPSRGAVTFLTDLGMEFVKEIAGDFILRWPSGRKE